ncbi:hypothetical protein OK349_03290 [Sphingomonas sp. BT-65]|uniref:hypothetical protein n=1 Tax=Sphingomonas sp. BT-65 TaxID=2989821 RepID=UPI00223634BD|nr:hypothetical protein [Sphingomonas sp. BT-65]MCW4460717.1 hypothetical protein [Sphingomonas sp. BT-65]
MNRGCGSGEDVLNCPWGQPLGAQVLYFALMEGRDGTMKPPYDFLHGTSPDAIILFRRRFLSRMRGIRAFDIRTGRTIWDRPFGSRRSQLSESATGFLNSKDWGA